MTPENTLNEFFEFFDRGDNAVQVVPLTVKQQEDDTRLAIFVHGEHEAASVIMAELMTRIDELFAYKHRRRPRVSQNLASSLLELNPRERVFVQSRLAGLSMTASAAAAGYPHPTKRGHELEHKPSVQAAMVQAMHEVAEEVGFTRKEAHEMLMTAYMNAATAGEQIAAVKEMIALHGIAQPKTLKVEHEHSGVVSLERMETHELMKLADMEDLVLDGEFAVVSDDQKQLPKL